MADTGYFHLSYSDRTAPRMSSADYCRKLAHILHHDPDAWTQGVFARTSNYGPCNPHDDRARSFCLLGLLAAFVDHGTSRQKILQVLQSLTGGHSIPRWNDNPWRTVAEVEALLLLAADRCEELYAGEPAQPDQQMLDMLVPFSKIMAQIESDALAA